MRDHNIIINIIYEKLPIKDIVTVKEIDEEINPGFLRVVYDTTIRRENGKPGFWFYTESIDIGLDEYRDKTLNKILNK